MIVSAELIETLNERAWEIALHETDKARALATEALERSRARGNRRGEALAKRTLGYCQLLSSELEEGLRSSREAAETLRVLGDKQGEATALNSLSVMYGRLGDYDKSLEFGLEALRLNQEVGDRRGEAWAYVEIGNVHNDVGDLAKARENFEKGLRIFEDVDYGPGTGRAHNLIGGLCERAGRAEEALRHYTRSLEIGKQSGLAISIVGNTLSIGRVHHESGNLDEARRFFHQAIESAEDLTLRELKSDVRLHVGRLELQEGNRGEARAHFEAGLRLIEGSLLRRTESQLHESLSELCEDDGDPRAALYHYKEFHRLRDRAFDEQGRARLKNLEIRLGVEKAEKEAEIERLRFVELAGMQAQLVQSEKMALLGRLVAGLSHELNTPIGVINSNASLSETAIDIMRTEGLDFEGNDRFRKAMESLESAHRATAQAGSRIAELVRSLKGYARLDEAELQRVDVSECVEETLQLFQTQLPGTVALERKLESLPEIACRPGQLNQVFMTVLVNAREAIDSNGRIEVSSFEDRGRAVIEISDTGRGIPSDRIPSLFEIDFSRKDSQVRLRMGLSNAKTIVEKHGGEIEVESVVGQGATFRIRLPLQSRMIPHFGGGAPWGAR